MLAYALRGVSDIAEHREQCVGGWSEFALLDCRGRMRGEHGELFSRIDAKVGFRALDARVPEPKRDFPYVAGRRERVHGATVPQHVRRHALVRQRRLFLDGGRDVLGQSMRETVPAHSSAVSIEKQLRGLTRRANRQPCPQHGLRLAPQRQHALAPPFPENPNRRERPLGKVVGSQRQQFGDAKARGIGQMQHGAVSCSTDRARVGSGQHYPDFLKGIKTWLEGHLIQRLHFITPTS